MRNDELIQVREIFNQVIDLSPTARAQFLGAQFAPDSALRCALENLLTQEQALGSFLANPILTSLDLFAFDATPNDLANAQIGSYRIVREIGRGGMGVVYEATRIDEVFSKQVAIKLVWPGLSQIVSRFRQERQILAQLEHPNIARLIDGGTTKEGWQYLVMEFVAGESISAFCQRKKLTTKQRLQLFLAICDAVQYAHQHLIIHRDLKPGNILVNYAGQVKLLDFGIAKIINDSAAQSDQTIPGTNLLTPEYASPEQLSGASINTAADIYSLGVVLHELLTEQRPYQFTSRIPQEVLHHIRHKSFTRMSERIAKNQPSKKSSELLKQLRGDLDNIVERALQIEPANRYQSVAQFSEDIHRYLKGEVVYARKPNVAYKLNRFIRRNKIAVGLGATVLMLLATWLTIFVLQAQKERVLAREQRRQLYAAEIKQAQEAWKNADFLQMKNILGKWLPKVDEEDLRGFEWGYLQHLVNGSSRTIDLPAKTVNASYFVTENAIVVGEEDQTVQVFDAATGQLRRQYPGKNEGWFGDTTQRTTKELYRLYQQQRIVTFDIFSGKEKQNYWHPAGRIRTFRVFFDNPLAPPSRYVIEEESGAVSIINTQSQQEIFRLPTQGKPISFFNFSLPHNLLVTVIDERNIRIDDITRKQKPRTFIEPSAVRFIEISADGQMLLLQNQTELYLRDVRTGRKLKKYSGNVNAVTYYAVAQTNHVIAIGKNDGIIEFCTFPGFKKVATFNGHTRSILWLGFSSNQQYLISTSQDRTVRLWEWQTGLEKVVLRGHVGKLTTVDFAPENGKLVTASQDQELRVWDWNEVTKPEILTGATDHILSVAYSPDGTHVAAGGKDNTAIIHNSLTGEQKILRGHQKYIYVVRFSPDGKWLATGSDDGSLKLWEVVTGREIKSFVRGTRAYLDGVRSLTFLSDGRTIAMGGNDGKIILWDALEERVIKEFFAHQKEILSISISHDGRLLATGSWDNTAKIWDTTTWQERAIITGHQGHIWSAEFSPDDKLIATGSGDQTIKLWNVATRQLLRTLTGHNDGIFQLAFTPDGKRLASVSDDQTVKIWNPQTGQDLLTLRAHTNEVWGVAFSPDGNTLLTGSWDKTLRLWRAVPK